MRDFRRSVFSPQVLLRQRHFQKPIKDPKWSFLWKILMAENRQLFSEKAPSRYLTGFWICLCNWNEINPLSANPTKWSNTLKQLVGKLPTNCLSVFDHFVRLEFKDLTNSCQYSHLFQCFPVFCNEQNQSSGGVL